MMSVTPPVKRRFTVIELAVSSAMIALLAIIAIPVLKDNSLGQARDAAERSVQYAVRRYYFDTHAYPTLGSPPSVVDDPWQVGSLPTSKSAGHYAGISFDAGAIKLDTGRPVKLSPDYLATRPKYAGDVAADGTARWRIDSQANVRIDLDGRSF